MHRSGNRRALAASGSSASRSTANSTVADTIAAPVFEALAKRKKVYTATYNREAKPSVVVRWSVLRGICVFERSLPFSIRMD